MPIVWQDHTRPPFYGHNPIRVQCHSECVYFWCLAHFWSTRMVRSSSADIDGTHLNRGCSHTMSSGVCAIPHRVVSPCPEVNLGVQHCTCTCTLPSGRQPRIWAGEPRQLPAQNQWSWLSRDSPRSPGSSLRLFSHTIQTSSDTDETWCNTIEDS